jgi:hypothetical protein
MEIKKTTEIKRHINKPDERYECDLIHLEPDRAVLRYISDRTFASTRLGVTFPPGCITIALYWHDRPYVFWGIFTPAGELLGHLVHICRDVEISGGTVSYLDMLLDLWFYPDGRHVVLDENEVAECLQSGLLAENDAAFIDEAKGVALADFEANTQEMGSFAAALDISARPQ